MMEIKGSFEFIEKRKAAYVVGCRFSIEKIKKKKINTCKGILRYILGGS